MERRQADSARRCDLLSDILSGFLLVCPCPLLCGEQGGNVLPLECVYRPEVNTRYLLYLSSAFVWRQDLSWTPSPLFLWDCLAREFPRIQLFLPSSSAGFTGTYCQRCWESKLSSPCLCRKHFIQWAIFPTSPKWFFAKKHPLENVSKMGIVAHTFHPSI